MKPHSAPAAQALPPGSPQAGPSHATPPGLVAIVDDDPGIAEALSMWLDLLDIRSAAHGSAESFLSQLHDEAGWPMLADAQGDPAGTRVQGMVVDINLPGMHGLALAQQLRARYPLQALLLGT